MHRFPRVYPHSLFKLLLYYTPVTIFLSRQYLLFIFMLSLPPGMSFLCQNLIYLSRSFEVYLKFSLIFSSSTEKQNHTLICSSLFVYCEIWVHEWSILQVIAISWKTLPKNSQTNPFSNFWPPYPPQNLRKIKWLF